MLKQRIITALVLAGLMLTCVIYLSATAFMMAALVLIAMAAWEWANLSGFPARLHRTLYTLFILFLFISCYWFVFAFEFYFLIDHRIKYLMIFSCFFWLLALFWILTYPHSIKYWKARYFRCVLGVVVLLPVGLGLLYLKQQQQQGGLIILMVAVIACADIGAYFFGKRFGRRKLAVNVSPGKSWEGVWGGMFCNLLFALIFSQFIAMTLSQTLLLIVVFQVTGLVSIIGDLFISMLKRYCGLKDCGSILPGHGGILDRIDGWTVAIPVFTLSYLLSSPTMG